MLLLLFPPQYWISIETIKVEYDRKVNNWIFTEKLLLSKIGVVLYIVTFQHCMLFSTFLLLFHSLLSFLLFIVVCVSLIVNKLVHPLIAIILIFDTSSITKLLATFRTCLISNVVIDIWKGALKSNLDKLFDNSSFAFTGSLDYNVGILPSGCFQNISFLPPGGQSQFVKVDKSEDKGIEINS